MAHLMPSLPGEEPALLNLGGDPINIHGAIVLRNFLMVQMIGGLNAGDSSLNHKFAEFSPARSYEEGCEGWQALT